MDPYCIVLEFMQNGTLYDYIYDLENPLDGELRVHFANDISLGMEFIHKNHMIHRDIKSPNILLTEEKTGLDLEENLKIPKHSRSLSFFFSF